MARILENKVLGINETDVKESADLDKLYYWRDEVKHGIKRIKITLEKIRKSERTGSSNHKIALLCQELLRDMIIQRINEIERSPRRRKERVLSRLVEDSMKTLEEGQEDIKDYLEAVLNQADELSRNKAKYLQWKDQQTVQPVARVPQA